MKRWQFWTLVATLLILAAAIAVDAVVRSDTRFEPEVWGTVSDWVIGVIFGLGTVLFAGLAWYWARRGSLAQEEDARIAGATAPVAFKVDCRLTHPNAGPTGDAHDVRLILTEDSVAVYLQKCEITTSWWAEWGEGHFEASKEWFEDLMNLDFTQGPGQGGVHVTPGTDILRRWETRHFDDTGRNVNEMNTEGWGSEAHIWYSITDRYATQHRWLRRDVRMFYSFTDRER